MIEIFSIFDHVSSVGYKEAIVIDITQNENKMQAWIQKIADNEVREMPELRTEMNEKLEKIIREVNKNKKCNQFGRENITNKIHHE